MLSRLQTYVRDSRQSLERDLAASPRKQYFSPAAYGQYAVTLPMLLQVAHGKLIDLGCGNMPFRSYVSGQVTAYDSLDLFPRRPDVTFIGDIQSMPMVPSDKYDTALCLEVLEHVPDPCAATREIARVVKAGGKLVVSVPHLSRLHDEPHDYYRYTRHGLRHLLEQAGFEVTALVKRGGLLSFLGHQTSTTWLGLTWRVPLLRGVAWSINEWGVTRPVWWLDQRLDRTGLFAMGYSAICQKRAP